MKIYEDSNKSGGDDVVRGDVLQPVVVNPYYEVPSPAECIDPRELMENIQSMQEIVGKSPDTNDFLFGFLAGLLCGSQRPDEIQYVFTQIVKVVPMNQLTPLQQIVDAVMSSSPRSGGLDNHDMV